MLLGVNQKFARIREDSGSTMVAVIGVLAVALITTTLIATSVVSALGFTTATRADVQSQAAAEAGIAVVQASLLAGTCTADVDTIEDVDGDGYLEAVFRGTDPEYTTTVKSWSGASPENGCPSSASTRVVVSGHGAAATPGLISHGDETVVQAEFVANTTPAENTGSGPAIYSGNGSAVNAMTITSATGVRGDIQILDGNFQCTTTSLIEGNVLVANGNVNITNTCTIKGDLRASGTINITSAAIIEGDVVAAGGGVSLSNSTIQVGGSIYANGAATIHGQVEGSVEATGSVYTNGGSRIKGNLKAGGSIRLFGQVDGNVTTPSTATFEINNGSGKVLGDLVVGGNLKPDGHNPEQAPSLPTLNDRVAYQLQHRGTVGGSISFLNTSSPMPVAKIAPVVPPWVDVEYRLTDWEGFSLLVWPNPSSVSWPASAECQIGSWNRDNHVVYQQIINATSPMIIDTSVCSNVTFGGTDLLVKTDVAFIGKSFTLGNGSDVISSDGENHYVWFIVPDGKPQVPGPNCSNGAGNISTNGQTKIHDKITALAYTPCTIALNNGTEWRGQLYSGKLEVSSNDSLKYAPIGIPGWNLDGVTVEEPSTESGGMFEKPTSQRNVSQ